ncbi:MAG: hypothetical protein M0026_07435 [Nocardiopsaceae bacterium]|nr:hypothetical protein [Nocardiopsaceae bacterium]
MFNRFTDDARQIAVLAQKEARELGHQRIGTEHLLLGLLAQAEGTGASALRAHGLELGPLRDSVGRIAAPAAQPPRRRLLAGMHIPFTKRAKKAMEQALRIALDFKQRSIGTGHVLLGTLSLPDGTASRVLAEAEVDIASLRADAERLTRGAGR